MSDADGPLVYTQPPPSGPWVMRQTWRDLLFGHWPVPVEMLRPLIPASLAVDTFDGAAWVGVVPFHMTGVRLRGTPFSPVAGTFPELNVRTYVAPQGPTDKKPGVWFFCLDAGSPVAVAVARRWFHLPYFNARMSVIADGEQTRYTSQRAHRGASPAAFAATYGPTGPIALSEPGTLAHWLTERYCLYTTDRRGRLCRGDIHHHQWPLQSADASITLNTIAAAHGITLPERAPLLHFARRLDVRCWRIRRVD
ncbi:MAG: DUF2071 domain-containing protein [Thermomicrobia bacterium]|nr:DUF2071 domain-containing protein [Thermomicrobia bacterium]MCA1723012.1 DUF2071 domain-containing protein [Thermomicrobia bacterium]